MTQTPFEELVNTHANWVYSTALRQVRDPHLAEDVTQAAFLLAASRAQSLLRHPRPSGWLFRTVCLCAKEAMRRERRQHHRDQEAARMRTEESAEPTINWDAISPLLDEAIGKLSSADREAILLRFYQQMPLAEVGRALSVSEDTARKRVTRAIDRLRDMLTGQGIAAGSTGLSAALLTNVTQHAPAQLAQSILAGSSTTAGTIAAAARKILAIAKLKLAAAVIVVAGVTVGVTVAVESKAPGPQPVTPANAVAVAPLPAEVPLEEDESKAAGKIQVVRWDMVLNETGYQLVRESLVPFETASKGFATYRCRGADLRNATTDAFDSGGVERYSREMMTAHEWADNAVSLFGHWGNYFHSEANIRVLMNFGGDDEHQVIPRTADGGLKLSISCAVDKPVVQEVVGDHWQRTEYPAAKAACDTTLSPGESMVFVGTYPMLSGNTYYGMVVWEAFSATEPEMSRAVAIRNTKWWCANGPAKLRQMSSIASLWKAHNRPSTKQELAPFTIKLEDGKTATLASLTMPSRWPFCWWDPAGNPGDEFDGIAPFWEDAPPKDLQAVIHVEGPPQEHKIASPTGRPEFDPGGTYTHSQCLSVSSTDLQRREIRASVLVGPWKEVARLKKEDQVTIDGTTYKVYKPSAFGDEAFLVHFDVAGPDRDAVELVAVAGEKQVGGGYVTNIGTPPDGRGYSYQPNFHGLPLEKVEYFRLMMRKRQTVTFGNVATEPRVLPPAAATREQAQAAEKTIADRAEQQKLQEHLDKRKAWQQTPPDPATPQGTLRAFANAVIANDAKAAEACYLASTPEAAACGRMLFDFMATRQQMHTLVAKRYGEMAVVENLRGRLGDVDDDWRDKQFKKVEGDDSAVTAGGLIFRKGADGKYRIDMDAFNKNHRSQLELRMIQRAYGRIPGLLAANPKMTIQKLRTAILTQPTTQP